MARNDPGLGGRGTLNARGPRGRGRESEEKYREMKNKTAEMFFVGSGGREGVERRGREVGKRRDVSSGKQWRPIRVFPCVRAPRRPS